MLLPLVNTWGTVAPPLANPIHPVVATAEVGGETMVADTVVGTVVEEITVVTVIPATAVITVETVTEIPTDVMTGETAGIGREEIGENVEALRLPVAVADDTAQTDPIEKEDGGVTAEARREEQEAARFVVAETTMRRLHLRLLPLMVILVGEGRT